MSDNSETGFSTPKKNARSFAQSPRTPMTPMTPITVFVRRLPDTPRKRKFGKETTQRIRKKRTPYCDPSTNFCRNNNLPPPSPSHGILV